MRNWEIKSRSRDCFSCGRPFGEEQLFHSLLDLRADPPDRRDTCERCWREVAAGRDRSAAAYWQSRFKRRRAQSEEEKIEKSLVQRLLEKYIDSETPEHVNLCFVLALLEERKKNLVVRGESRDDAGNRLIVYEHSAGGRSYLIRDPGLSLARADEVEKQIMALLAEEEESLSKAGEGEEGSEASPGDLPTGKTPGAESEEKT